MSPLDYIVGIYKKDKQMVENIVDDIRELKVISPEDIKTFENGKEADSKNLLENKTIKQYQEEKKSLLDIMRIYLGIENKDEKDEKDEKENNKKNDQKK